MSEISVIQLRDEVPIAESIELKRGQQNPAYRRPLVELLIEKSRTSNDANSPNLPANILAKKLVLCQWLLESPPCTK